MMKKNKKKKKKKKIKKKIKKRKKEENEEEYIIKKFWSRKYEEFNSFACIHYKAKQFSIDNIDDFAGKKSFLGSCLKFIYNSFKYKNNSLINLIISIVEDCYCNSNKKYNNLPKWF